MQINQVSSLLLCLFLVACGEEESEVAKNIKLKVSSGAIVLPTKLIGVNSDLAATTCMLDDVEGPRIRMRASIIWSGTGNLIPFLVRLELDNPALSGKFAGLVSPGDESESVSSLFGVTTDYIEPDGIAHASTTCFLDFGGLPEPKAELTGRRELRIRGQIFMTGVSRTDAGIEKPFVKEVPTDLIYVAGSVPAEGQN